MKILVTGGAKWIGSDFVLEWLMRCDEPNVPVLQSPSWAATSIYREFSRKFFLMKAIPLFVPNAFIIEPCVFNNECGLFYEIFNHTQFHKAVGGSLPFVQSGRSGMWAVLHGLLHQIQQLRGEPFTQSEIFA